MNTALPTISGTAQVGQTLTATTGTWTNSPTSFTYQWNRAGTPIAGATASTYVPVTADIGNTLTVSVTAANSWRLQHARDERGDQRRHRYHSDEQLCPNDLRNRAGGPDVDGDNRNLDAQSNLLHLSMETRGDGDLRGHGLDLRSCHGGCREHADGFRRRHELGRLELSRDERGHKCGYSGQRRRSRF